MPQPETTQIIDDIIEDIKARHGLKEAWEKVVDDARTEIRSVWAVIIEANINKGAGIQPKGEWVPITCEADLEQPPGLYWITFTSGDKLHIGSDRIHGIAVGLRMRGAGNQFAANTVAYMRIEEPEPWKG